MHDVFPDDDPEHWPGDVGGTLDMVTDEQIADLVTVYSNTALVLTLAALGITTDVTPIAVTGDDVRQWRADQHRMMAHRRQRP